MSDYSEIHERLMNRSRTILPRVGGGVGEGVGDGSSSLNQVQTVKAVGGQRHDGLDLG